MAKFITLNHQGEADEVILNLQFVASIETYSGGEETLITLCDGRKFKVAGYWPSQVLNSASDRRIRRRTPTFLPDTSG